MNDCRDCKNWISCPCGKQGHDKGTSIGYSSGECKDFQNKQPQLKHTLTDIL